ncbi:hypothetical protein C8A00DRAFT_28971 [Chaetomidium leptoderma]|uniref:Uncharacterized protein n=1 Tax=Chaetomidium leptoderma TaxID=669021 RepID=A0AAN6VUI7_9PEZI|nr:hypothetical protein C8A00DRAFT_28971 [Chaetomidium leptoderma]
MVGSAFALSLIGLGAVQALPAGKAVEERQGIWIGDGTGVFIPGQGELPTCLTDVALQEQPPCILPPIVGGLEPSTKKRDIKRRQVWIGDGGSTFTPGQGELPTCQTNIGLREQPPCILPPIVGGLEPSTKRSQLDERQGIWLGDGSTTFTPGQGGLPTCQTSIALKEQPPCLLPPIVGGLEPSTKKRQVIIGGGSSTFTPGQGALPTCQTNIGLKEQPPCLLPPIVGGMEPSTKKRQVIIGDGTGVFIPGQGELPTCLTDVSLQEQPPCILPPIVGGLEPSTKKRGFVLPPDYATNTKKVIETLELELIRLQNKKNKSRQDLQDIEAIRGALRYLAGITSITAPPGTGSTFTPGKRGFVLPPDYATNTKKVIETLERDLIRLQNKKNKSRQDVDDIQAIKGALMYLAGITSITAPPGTGSTFTPGKRGFVLPPDYATNTKKVIQTLELELIRLQNKNHKSQQDVDDIQAIKGALMYLAGITSISAPPGTGSTFTPGKRDAEFSLATVGTYASECPNLVGAELALETLMHKDKPSPQERIIMQQLAAFLRGCGITIVKSPDGTWTTIKPSDKRDVQFDVTGLETAYFALLQAASDIAPAQPSFANWLALQQISGLLETYGISTASFTVDSAGHPKRQTDTITVGTATCALIDVMGLRAALAALLTAYGPPSKAPVNIFLIEQVIVTALHICGQSVEGWTTIIPGSPVPGGPMVPDPTVPGGPMIPDPTVPGAEIKPSDKKMKMRRQAPVGDPAAMLAALKTLEDAYGVYGSGKIPVPVFLIMVNLVTILQSIPGVLVPGWPVLGQGSVVLTPST